MRRAFNGGLALRGHAALVRALLEELERVVPAAGVSPAEEDIVGAQLVEELTRLGRRILDCSPTMTQAPGLTIVVDPEGRRLAGSLGDLAEGEMDRQNGAMRSSDDCLGHAAHHEALEPGAAACAHHDHVELASARERKDLVGG
jgi:hypothetical protein